MEESNSDSKACADANSSCDRHLGSASEQLWKSYRVKFAVRRWELLSYRTPSFYFPVNTVFPVFRVTKNHK